MEDIPSRLSAVALIMLFICLVRCVKSAVDIVGDAKLAKLADEGNKRAEEIRKITDNQARMYNSFWFVTILAGFFAAVLTASTVGSVYDGDGKMPGMVPAAALLILAVLFLGVCGYAPRRISKKSPERVLLALSPILSLVYFVSLPFNILTEAVFGGFFRLIGFGSDKDEDEVTEEEIRLMVDIGSENGTIDPDEKEMIHNIFELDDTQVKDIMTHRTDIVFLWLEDSISEWERIIGESNHSIYPVCGETVDDVIGVLSSRDFYKTLRNAENEALIEQKSMLRQPFFVPESIRANDLFRTMQRNRNHFAVVLDEYGGLGGIVSMSDLLEEIVGDLDNDYDSAEEEDIVQLDANTWRISGSAEIDLVSEELGIELPVEEYNTLAGMILGELGTIPEDGTTAEIDAYGLNIKATRIVDHRIEEAVVCKTDPEKEDKTDE